MFQGIAAYIRNGIKADLEGRGIEPDQNKFAVCKAISEQALCICSGCRSQGKRKNEGSPDK